MPPRHIAKPGQFGKTQIPAFPHFKRCAFTSVNSPRVELTLALGKISTCLWSDRRNLLTRKHQKRESTELL